MSLGSATILINVSIPHLQRELSKAKRVFRTSMQGFDNTLGKDGEKAAKKLTDGFQKGIKKERAKVVKMGSVTGKNFVQGIISKISAGKAAVAGAVAILAVAAAKSLQAFFNTERKLVRLDAAFKSTGHVVGLTAGQVEKMAERMSRVSFVSKDQLLEAAAITASFGNIVGENFEKTVKVAADLSVLMGTDVRTAALQLGKALADPTRGLEALRESGVVMTRDQEDMIKTMFKAGKVAEAQNEIFKVLAQNGVKDVSDSTKNAVGDWEKFKNVLLRVAEAGGRVLQFGGLLGIVFGGLGLVLEGTVLALSDTANALDLIGDSLRELAVPDPDASAWDKYIQKVGEADEAIMRLNANIATNTQKASDRAKAEAKGIQEQIDLLNELRGTQEKNQALASFIASETAALNKLFIDPLKARIDGEKQAAKIRAAGFKEQKDSAKINLNEQMEAINAKIDAEDMAFNKERDRLRELIKLENEKAAGGRSVTFGGAESGFAQANVAAAGAQNKREQAAKKLRVDELRGQIDQAQLSKDLIEKQAEDEIKRIKQITDERLKGIEASKKAAEAASDELLARLGVALRKEIELLRAELKELPFVFKTGTLAIAIEKASKLFGQGIADKLRSRISVIGRTDRPDLGDAAFNALQQNVNRAIRTVRETEKSTGVTSETIESRRVLNQLLHEAEQAKFKRDAQLIELRKLNAKKTETTITLEGADVGGGVFSTN